MTPRAECHEVVQGRVLQIVHKNALSLRIFLRSILTTALSHFPFLSQFTQISNFDDLFAGVVL